MLSFSFSAHPLSYISTVCSLCRGGVGVNIPTSAFYIEENKGWFTAVLTYKHVVYKFTHHDVHIIEKQAIEIMRELLQENKENDNEG